MCIKSTLKYQYILEELSTIVNLEHRCECPMEEAEHKQMKLACLDVCEKEVVA